MKKRLLSILLCCVMLVGLLPTAAFAADEATHTHPICGATCTDGEHTDNTWQPIYTAADLFAAKDGYYYLANDVEFKRYDPEVKSGVVLCLNGHSISQTWVNRSVIQVTSGTFTLTDCKGGGTNYGQITRPSGNSGHGVYVNGGTFNLYGGNITKNNYTGVYIGSGTFNMYGGSISQNLSTAGYGGGVNVTNGCTFNMYGGSITGNTSRGGGGVYINYGGTFNLSGGSITGNTASTPNYTAKGGGVFANGGAISVSGNPVVKDNTVSDNASNIYLTSNVTMSVKDMTSGAEAGITTEKSNYPVVFSNACDTDYSSYFFADDANAHVEYNSDKKLQLAKGAPVPHTHIPANTWSSDATYHWHTCTVAGCNEKIDQAEHTYESDAATSCTFCNRTRHVHSWAEDWTSDDSYHWHKCTGVGCDVTSNKAAHTWGDDGRCTECGCAKAHTHCICGGDVAVGDHTSHSDVTYQKWDGNNSSISYSNNAAYVYLTDDAQIPSNILVQNGKTLYLCLNGKEYAKPSSASGQRKFIVTGGGHLILCDCVGTGSINCGKSDGGGGCVYLENSTMDMYGGKFTGSSAAQGGAIAVVGTSTLNLYGGKISGNMASEKGGAVYVESGTVNISGKPVVKDNTVSENANNIYLANEKTVSIIGNMTSGAEVGITTEKSNYPVVFSNACDTDYSRYFFADDANAHVEYNSDKQLQLAAGAPSAHEHVWADTWSSNDTHHWHNCTADGCDITDNAQKDGYAEHSGTDDGNCTTAVECECGYVIKNAELEHNYPDKWTAVRPGSTHTRKCQNEGCSIAITNSCVSDEKATCQEFAKCTICGGDCGTKADHNFTAETVGEDYLKSAATCTAKAVYYKSCSVCGLSSQGMTGEATFEGGFDADSHTGELSSSWKYDTANHWKEYTCCQAKAEQATHVYDNDADMECNICQYRRSKAEVKFNSITAVGNGDGNWLHGANWAVDDSSNHMTETSQNVYEITYTGVAAYDQYEVKFAADNSWTNNWGAEDYTKLSGNAVCDATGIKFSVDADNSTVKLVLDLSNYDPDTKTGATYSITVTPPHAHPICGATCSDGKHTDQTWQAISTAEELSNATNGYYYLANDVTLENQYMKDGVVLCLNGYSIKSQKDMPVIDVFFGRTFTLTDCTGKGTITHDSGNSGYGVRVYGGTFNLYGGSITGNGSTGVHVQRYEYVQSDNIFNMYGGSITGNHGTGYGGGVYVTSGCTFNMYGGSITGNKQAGGGGVDVDGGTFNLRGGNITGNTGTSFGGGVYVAGGTVNISGNPVIEGNTVSGKADNLYLFDHITLSVSEMTSGAKIGITTKDISYPVVFSSVCDTNYSEYFFADDANAHVEYNSDKKLQLAHTHAWATAWTYDETHHWHECANSGCDVTENSGKDSYGTHVYDDETDMECNTCGYQRTIAPITYTVSFDANGGSVHPASMTTGADGKLVSLPTPTRSSYSFDGWYTEKSGGTKVTAETEFEANITVYAHWIYTGGSGGDSGCTYYTLTFKTNGGSTITSERFRSGTMVDLTKYTPTRKGCTFTGWYSDKGLTSKITSIRLDGNKTVYAGWKKQTAENPFIDVSKSDWFYDGVMFAYETGLMVGTSDTLFSPYGTATRAMMATVLWRMEGSSAPKNAPGFTDVASGKWYSDAIAWTTENGIYQGYGSGKFGPDDPITREQLAAIFYRYADYKGYDMSIKGSLDNFKDKVSAWAQDAMQWAVGSGLIQGKTGSVLDPQGTATRAEIAAMLHRFIEKYGLVEDKAPAA